jgi:predicted DNA-binding transcriptional regulator AlpA
MFERPYTSTDVCEAIGISKDTFYRTREIRHERDGLPRPISERGPLKWERSGFDAWLTRFHPLRPPRPANDVVRRQDAATIEEHQRLMHLEYGIEAIAAAKAKRERDRKR